MGPTTTCDSTSFPACMNRQPPPATSDRQPQPGTATGDRQPPPNQLETCNLQRDVLKNKSRFKIQEQTRSTQHQSKPKSRAKLESLTKIKT